MIKFSNCWRIFSFIGVVSTLFVSCSSSDVEPQANVRHEISLTTSTRAAAEALQPFYVKFTGDAVIANKHKVDKKSENVIVSPLSASMLLGMVANGVEPEIATKIAEYLGISDLEALNQLSLSLLKGLPEVDNKVDFTLANSVWSNSNFSLSSDFSTCTETYYNGKLQSVDFSDSKKVVAAINSWIDSFKKGGKNVHFEGLSSSSLAVLLNTLYFKGEWGQELFVNELTTQKEFTGFSGSNMVEMMCAHSAKGLCSVTEKFSMCELDFGNGGFSLRLILPLESFRETSSIPQLTQEDMEKLNQNQKSELFQLYLPKFNLTHTLNINKLLEIANFPDLNGILNFPMFTPAQKCGISLLQNTGFSVDEKGAEAESLSSGEISFGSYFPNNVFVFDEPFYFFLTEKSTGACILSGLIADL